jgi:protein tyrosine phosphatase (PTP) superfamily phosphohydrolase (DUF442 family)
MVLKSLIVISIALAQGFSVNSCSASTGASSESPKPFICAPCGCGKDNEKFDRPGNCPACNMELIDESAKNELSSLYSFRRVNDRVCTGGQPTLEHLEKLKAEGVKAIINLRPPNEHEAAKEEAKAKELGLRYFNIPVVYREPKDEQATEFLKLTDDLKNEHIFIHCAAAIRVGAFWMIRRVLRDGWTYEQALEEANKIGLRDRPHLVEFARKYIESHRK